MYLSKLILDPRDVYAKQCMRDCQKMHRSVMRMFHCTRKEGGVLYRFNPDQFSVYILSQIEPDSSNTAKGMKFCGFCSLNKVEQQMEPASRFVFDLIACPSKKVPVENQKNSKRKFLDTVEERFSWLQRKGVQNGFHVINVGEEILPAISGKHDEQDGGVFYSASVRFYGILEVTDKEKFYHAYYNGIGSGKAYGQGMLLIRRLVQ